MCSHYQAVKNAERLRKHCDAHWPPVDMSATCGRAIRVCSFAARATKARKQLRAFCFCFTPRPPGRAGRLSWALPLRGGFGLGRATAGKH